METKVIPRCEEKTFHLLCLELLKYLLHCTVELLLLIEAECTCRLVKEREERIVVQNTRQRQTLQFSRRQYFAPAKRGAFYRKKCFVARLSER